MGAPTRFASALAALLCGVAPIWAQAPAPAEPIAAPAGLNQDQKQPESIPPAPRTLPAPPPEGTTAAPAATAPAPGEIPFEPPAALSDWITYNRHGCCEGPVGNHRPFMTELFLRSGVVSPLAATTVGRNLDAGWEIQGGGRLLLFNPPLSSAWTIEASLSTMENWHGSLETKFPLSVIIGGARIAPNVTIKSLNRTFVNLGPGREWYLFGTAADPGRKFRIGVDGGGRWGSAKMELNEIPHRTDTIAGLYAAIHGDLEIPCSGCCVFYAGLRLEYDYTWMDILQRVSDVQDINALATFGVRW